MTEAYYLPAQKLKLRQSDDGSLVLNLDGQSINLAQPKRALPLSEPDRFIVLYDMDGNELGIVRDVAELEPTSRELLQENLKQAYIIEHITRILEVERDTLTGQTRWRVEIATDTPRDQQDDTTTDNTNDNNGASNGINKSNTGESKASESNAGDNETDSDKLLGKIQWLRHRTNDKDQKEQKEKEHDDTSIITEEREFLINGQEDVQTARYPTIFIVDTERNRYEIPNCEELDLDSRRAAERFF